MPWLARIARYSGSERPACRMNHTGRRDGVPPVAAATSGRCDRWTRVPVTFDITAYSAMFDDLTRPGLPGSTLAGAGPHFWGR
ncbi:hypothetical protein GORBP_053_00800 [Gordonia rubripertincta NBRC 101908]|uniref:Uncharacterized protein n=1 Tax=Gordonia rubripertincta NBRC 101908 TaxID=1077975 RepID=A0ABQ0HS41_GORRU|nr:hypothetical protein GORBP_053_00800 [Gordonia rubripertincta NBRC 101908]